MGLRTVGRWLYHAITSSEKRPYIQSDLSELEALVAKATEDRGILKLFAILDELKYRISSPAKRDQLVKQIISILGEYEGILLAPSVNHAEIAAARRKFEINLELREQEQERQKREERDRKRQELAAEQLRREEERKEAERKAREAAAEKERLEAETKAQQEQAERKEAERKAREAADEKARLEAETKAQQEEAERKEAERKAREAAAEKERLEAEAKAQQEEAERKEAERKTREAAAEKERLEAETKAQQEEAERKEAQRKAREAAAEKERLEAEAKAQQEEAERKEAERKAREAAAEKDRLEAEAEAQRHAEEEEQARLAAEADRLRLEQGRREVEAEAQRSAQEEEQARQTAEAEHLRLEEPSGIAEEVHSTAVVENATTAEVPAPEDAIIEPRTYTDKNSSNKIENETEDSKRRNTSISGAARRRSSQLDERGDDDAKPKNQSEAEDGDEDELEPVESEFYAESSSLDRQEWASDLSTESREDRTSKIDRVWERRLERDLMRMEARERNEPKKDHQQDLGTLRNGNRNETSRLDRLEASSAIEEDNENHDIKSEDLINEDADSEAGTDSVAIGSYQLNPDWRRWSEEEWNCNLLRYCFVDNANNGDSYGIPSSEEDLRYVVSDDQAASVEIAEALTTAILARASRHGKRPALLCKQRVERWNPLGNTEPPFFAFLWSTCMISQGYPNPNADGEFHARYERVYGFQERTNCQALIPAWEMLAQWLARDDVFPSESHRKLKLPTIIDLNKKNISHSWKLSFPRRSDRSILSVALEDLLDQGTSLDNITDDILRYIRGSGGFSPEFNKLLGEQLQYVETGLVLEEWFENLIEREIQCLIEIDSDERTRNSERRAYTSDQLILRVDVDDPGSIYLVLPKQKLEKPDLKDNSVKYCIIDPAGEEFLADTKRGWLVIEEEVCDLVESIQDEWIWRLRIGSLSGTTVEKWRCPGVTKDVPVLCFCPITGQRLSAFHLRTVGQEALIFLPRTFGLTATEDIEVVERYKWPSINGYHGFHLEKSVASTTLVFTSTTEFQGELSIPWSSTSSEKPCLTGPLIRGRKLTYTTAPILWLPPSKQSTTVELSIRDLQTNQVASEETMIIDPSDQWFKHDLALSLTNTGRFAVRTSLVRMSPEMPLKWRENFFLAGPALIDNRCPQDMAIEHQLFDSSRTLSLADFIPHYFDGQEGFWLSDWILRGLWPFEPVMIQLSGAGESHRTSAVASPDGAIRISTSEFRNALPDRVNSFRLCVQPHGMRSPITISLFGSQDDWLREDEQESNVGVKAPPPTPKRRFSCMVILSSLNYSGPVGQSESSSKNIKNVRMFVDKMTKERDAARILSDDIEIGHADTNVWIIISRNELRDEVKRLVNSVQEEVPFRITLGSYKRHGI
jgi:hypothetical protein